MPIAQWPYRIDAPAAGGLPILDNFNRANENPLSDGGKWAHSNMQLISNAATSGLNGTTTVAFWNPTTFGPDCAAFVTVGALPASGNGFGLYLRTTNPGVGTENSYLMQWGPTVSAGGCTIYKETASGSFTQLAQNTALVYIVGDVIKFEAVGTTLTAYKNGVSVLSVSDATYGSAGYFGLRSRDTTLRLDDFGGGTL